VESNSCMLDQPVYVCRHAVMKFNKCIYQASVQHLANVLLKAWDTWNAATPVAPAQRIMHKYSFCYADPYQFCTCK